MNESVTLNVLRLTRKLITEEKTRDIKGAVRRAADKLGASKQQKADVENMLRDWVFVSTCGSLFSVGNLSKAVDYDDAIRMFDELIYEEEQRVQNS